MKLLLHAWSLGTELLHGRASPWALPALAQEAGFAGVEFLDRLLPSYEPRAWRKLGADLTARGMLANALSISLELDIFASWAREQIERTLVLLAQCPLMRIKSVRISVGGMGLVSVQRGFLWLDRLRPAGARGRTPLGPLARAAYGAAGGLAREKRHQGLPPRARPADLDRLAGLLRPLARRARDLGLALGVENHFGYTSHPGDLIELCQRTGHGLGVCLDTGNFLSGQDPVAVCQELADRAVHAHLKTRSPNPEGRAGDYAARLQPLKRVGYAGLFSLEYEGPGDGLAGARAGARLVRELWQERGLAS